MSDVQNFENGLQKLATIVPKLIAGVRDFLQSDEVISVMRVAHRNLICQDAGWLFHYTTPIHLFTDEMNARDAGTMLEEYYRTNWPDIETSFRHELQASDVDDEAKAAFDEALRAHRAGLYRCSVRTLFPEIERQARIHFNGGKLNSLASLKEVRKAIGGLGWSELQEARNGPVFVQFATMAHHLYEKVETQESFEKFSATPIPNRHAAVHGLISYDSMQSSIAALIMTEFMFRMITFIKNRDASPETSNPA
ncbi:hypothetical protein WSK_2068 [Novosphingobium sp. Rr 2-17]|uniref:hypothetical protein n=1 Tax=Novosphingobium sp. Rr 2-17 TaxID=555793 RepID=UPI000269888E|nr:hypothetical protein [Novosphingobium sp. Rr 2-17]EIZ79223.1 hypothetical protein WSK_2068 [Novosphingobium sp. Rr 2-17]